MIISITIIINNNNNNNNDHYNKDIIQNKSLIFHIFFTSKALTFSYLEIQYFFLPNSDFSKCTPTVFFVI